jgi:hypothetical protein
MGNLIIPKRFRLLEDETGAPRPFNPADVPNLLGWWSASDLVFNASSALAANDEAVATWTDKVNGKSFTQSTNDNRPIYKTNIINGRSIVRFDGSNDALLGDADVRAFSQGKAEFTIFCVGTVRAFAAGNTTHILVMTGAAGGARLTATVGTNNSGVSSRRTVGRGQDNDSFSELASASIYGTTPEIFVVQADVTNKSGRMLRNGTQILSFNQYANMTAGTFQNTTSQYVSMGSNNGSSACQYDAADMLLFDSLVSDDNLALLSNYFNSIYNLY